MKKINARINTVHSIYPVSKKVDEFGDEMTWFPQNFCVRERTTLNSWN